MKKTTAPAMSAKPTTPPAIAPVNVLLLCDPPLPEPECGEAVTVIVAELEMVTVGVADDAVASGVSMTNFQIRRVGMFERLTSNFLSSGCVECIADRHIQVCPFGNSCPRWYAFWISR